MTKTPNQRLDGPKVRLMVNTTPSAVADAMFRQQGTTGPTQPVAGHRTEGARIVVHEATVPPFAVLPEIILWDNKVFKRLGDGKSSLVITEYIEAWSYHLYE